MTTVAIVFPFDAAGDAHRSAAFDHVLGRYEREHPRWLRAVGSCSGEWSKGRAVANAIAELGGTPDVLVLADADSFVSDPDVLRQAVAEIETDRARWVTPHRYVFRLKADETDRVLAGAKPRLGHTIRAVYEGPIGGGITVVSRAAFEEVRGIDERFLGWGGEDLAFGWALETLAPPGVRLEGALVHLWHPHPAPNLRGSEESERLVAQYRSARGLVRRMRQMVDHEEPVPPPPLDEPVRFRMMANRRTHRLTADKIVRFDSGVYETSDPDEVDALRAVRVVREEPRKVPR